MEQKVSAHGEITVELMQQTLRTAENDNSIVVLPCLEVKDLNDDLHLGSYISRVVVKYTRNGDTSEHSLSLIVKVVPEKNLISDIVQQSNFFTREIYMYEEILPRMSVLLSRALGDRHTDFTARRFYTRKTPTYMITVEDLAPKGFKSSMIINELDLEHCLLVFRTLARFHAASVMIRDEDKNLFNVFDTHTFQEPGMLDFMKKVTGNASTLITRATENWPEFGPSWANRLRRRYQTLFDDLHHLLERDDSRFNVLTHGDFGVHNLLFRHSESNGELEAVMLVDFQCCSFNSPVLDLHQFIHSSARDEVREKHIDTLLVEYHTELTATLEALGAHQEHIISQKQFFEEFYNKMLFGFMYATCAIPFASILSDPNSGLTREDFLNLNDEMVDKLQPKLPNSFFECLRIFLTNYSKNSVI